MHKLLLLGFSAPRSVNKYCMPSPCVCLGSLLSLLSPSVWYWGWKSLIRCRGNQLRTPVECSVSMFDSVALFVHPFPICSCYSPLSSHTPHMYSPHTHNAHTTCTHCTHHTHMHTPHTHAHTHIIMHTYTHHTLIHAHYTHTQTNCGNSNCLP